VIARPVPGRPAPGGGLAVLVVVTVLAVLAAPQLGRLRPLVDRLRELDQRRVLPHRPKPSSGAAGGMCPVKGPVRIGQGWGAPRDGGRRRHQGIDLLAPTGTPLVAVTSGTITHLSNQDRGRGGISLWLRDARGTTYYYAHNHHNLVHLGQQVKAGQLLARVGATGNARGGPPHPTSSSTPAAAARSAPTRWCGGGADDPGRLARVGAVAAGGRPRAAPQPHRSGRARRRPR